MKIKKISGYKKKNDFLSNILFFVSLVWFVIGISYLFSEIGKDYGAPISFSLDANREFDTGKDFYQFLMFCDNTIPKGKDLKWVFPEGGFLGNSEYHFFKAYYYLYPRNYKEDADYIIVYGREGFDAPAGFKLLAGFGQNKYILSRN